MIFDVHSHLQFPEYDVDRDEVIGRMRAAGVKTITVGTDMKTSKNALALAKRYPRDMWATVGIHPTNLEEFDADAFRELLNDAKTVAVGECGLDYYRIVHNARETKERQKALFMEQAALAAEARKPLMIHCRPSQETNDAYEDLISILKINAYPIAIIIHFFVGSCEVAEQLSELGCYYTFGGVISFARDYDEAIRGILLERILLETDAPYVAPTPHRGKRNEPAYVIEVAKKMAEIKKVDYEEICAVTAKTAGEVFGI